MCSISRQIGEYRCKVWRWCKPLTNDSSTTAEPTTEAPTTTTEEPTTEVPTMPPTIPPTTLATTTTTTGKSMPGLTIDYVDWIEVETFDLAAHEIFNTVNMTPSGKSDRFWLNQDELTRTAISLAQTFSNTSKIRFSSELFYKKVRGCGKDRRPTWNSCMP